MKLASAYKSLCLPSKVYFVLSVIAVLLTIVYPSVFGRMSVIGHLGHVIYLVFWTWILNLICGAGYKWFSWVLVLAPFVLTFLIIVFFLSDSSSQEVQTIVIRQ
jgi:hypothetical protein